MLLYRLGLDMGTNSLGWCALQLDTAGNPVGLLDWGSRIFNDGREPAKKEVPGDSSAVQRREARGMRRRYDRRLMRRKNTLRQLVKHGLMPEVMTEQKKLEALNPLEMRSKAVSHKLQPYEIGRALFHLQQRRGFKSNRKEAQKEGNALSPMKEAMRDLEADLKQNTLGQFLYALHQKRENTRVRPRANGAKMIYDRYPTRAMVEDEFNRIWDVQAAYHPALLNEEARKAIHKAIFFQRPLAPQIVGKCLLVPTDHKMAWAMPSAQAFRIIKEINNLKIIQPGDYTSRPQPLSQEQRKKLYDALRSQGSMTFKKIKKELGLPSGVNFNLESELRKHLLGDKTAEMLRKESQFGLKWDAFTLAEQDAIAAKLLDDAEEDEALVQWLQEDYGLSAEQAEKTIEAPLPAAHAAFGATVITGILPRMIEGMLEHEAIADCGWNHSQQFTGECFEQLPYYGELLEQHVVPMPKSTDPMVKEYGRINNPTVHIALNQLRRLLNRLKDHYGCWPQEITLEMARDLKKGRTEIAEILKAIDTNTKQKEKWQADIEKTTGRPATSGDFAKMKLWYELDATHRKCVFSGTPISLSMLLSDAVEIEHILPRSLTLDDTAANKTLATREANRIKGNRTPYEAFKDRDYDSIAERAQLLPASKRWRFRPDAMEVFDSKAKTIVMKSSLGYDVTVGTGLDSFAARQLNDTSYMAKLAKKYLAYACEKGEHSVTATPGTLTGLLRKAWGLNDLLSDDSKKNRNDHRHHAIDALVVAMTTRSMVKKVADAAKKEEEGGLKITKILGAEKPWPDFAWSDLKARAESITISHKPDHGSPATGGTSGRLHEDTYYGYVGEGSKKGAAVFVVRKPIDSFEKLADLEKIRDKTLAQTAHDYVTTHAATNEKGEISKDAMKKALAEFSQKTGIQRVRVLVEKSRDAMVNPKSTPQKWMQGGSNHRAEIYCPKSGKQAGKWQTEIIKTFDANQKDYIATWRTEYPDAELVMVLHGGDMVAYEEAGETQIRKVKKMTSAGRIYFLPHTFAKDEGDKFSKDFSSASGMQERKMRRIFVEIDGSIYDPLGLLTTPKRVAQ